MQKQNANYSCSHSRAEKIFSTDQNKQNNGYTGNIKLYTYTNKYI